MTIKKIQASLDSYVGAEGHVLVALSGGVDSMVALHATKLLRPDLRITAAHVHHGLREEAQDDVELCRLTCEAMGVELHIKKADVGALAKDRGVSIELAGREVRHEFFQELRDASGCDAVILGHHADDRVETVLHNFMRGSGIHGLGSMKEWSEFSRYLRPLLSLTKRDIVHWAREHDISWHEDKSNHEVDFDRNWLRNEVIPMLETRRSGMKQSILRVASTAESISDYMRSQARDIMISNIVVHSNVEKSTFFDIDVIMNAHPAMQSEIVQFLWTKLHGSSSGFSQKRVHEVLNWVSGPIKNGSSLYFGGDVRLCNRNGRIGAIAGPEVMNKVISDICVDKDTEEHILTNR